MIKKHVKPIAAFVACIGWIICQAPAAIFSYSDISGIDVTYVGIEEDTGDEPNALFGAPDIVGNTLDFDPLSFFSAVSSSTGENNSRVVDGQLNFTIMSLNNAFDITDVIISESGDYTLAGLGTAQATAAVNAPVLFSVTHVNGAMLGAPVNGGGSLVFSPNGGSYDLSTGTFDTWSGILDVDIRTLLDDEGILGAATKIEFSVDNRLTTGGVDGGSAFIAKKDFNVTPLGEVIPEPDALSLLGIGLLAGFGFRRRA